MGFVNSLIDLSCKVDLHSGLGFMYYNGGSCAQHNIDGTLYEIFIGIATDTDIIKVITEDFTGIVSEDFDDIVAVKDIQGSRFIRVTPIFFSSYKTLYTKQYQNRLKGVNFVTGNALTVLVDSGFKDNKELKRNVELLEKLLVHQDKDSFIVYNIYKNMSGIEHIKTNKQEI